MMPPLHSAVMTWPPASATTSPSPDFADFIEPTRNTLLKEFEGGLQLRSDAFGLIAAVTDAAVPGGVSHVAAFDAREIRDLKGKPVLPQLHAAMAFWDRCLSEAEADFGEGSAAPR